MSRTVSEVFFPGVVVAASALLFACGPAVEPEQAGPAEVAPEVESLTSNEAELCPSGTICSPTAAVSCTRNTRSGDVNCTGSGSGGVTPYRYFWRTNYYYYSSGYTYYGTFYEGGSTYYEWCPRGIYVDPDEWQITVEMYIVDVNNYGSNVASVSYYCSAPSGAGG